MNILFLCHYFPPEVNAPASRTFEHCRAWAKNGHDVTVLTCVPNHPAGRIYPGYKNKLYQVETIEGIRVIRLWTYITPNEGFFKRTLNFLVYALLATLAAFFCGRADRVISTSPQFFCGLAGGFVHWIKRAPWVLEVRDLWPESLIAVGATRSRFIVSLLETLERLAYRWATHIVVVSNAFKPHIAAHVKNADKISVITNGVDLTFFDPDGRQSAFKEEHALQSKFCVLYAGTIGMAHGLQTLVETAELLKNEPDIQVIVVGDGAEKQALLNEISARALENILVLPQQPKARMPDIYAGADICIVMLKGQDTFKMVLPSKMFEIMAMERPIILSVDGESRAVLERAGAGIAVRPDDPLGIADVVQRLRADADLRQTLGDNGRRFVSKEFNRQRLAEQFEDLLVSLGA